MPQTGNDHLVRWFRCDVGGLCDEIIEILASKQQEMRLVSLDSTLVAGDNP